MKKQLIIMCFAVLIITGVALTAYTQQKDNKGKKEQAQGKKNNDNKSKQDKGNNGKNDGVGQPAKGQKDHQVKQKGNDDNLKNNKGNNSANNNKNNKGNNGHWVNDWNWNDETFKDRKNLRNQEKVTLCHKVNNDGGVTIRVSSNAVKAHMNHGDVAGDCAINSNSAYSDIFLRKRNDYYTTLQNSYEQVSYSRSILDYAIQRLTNSRLQLANMQQNNVARAELERKQAAVADLEQNVSLLETLIGVTANIVINKLQQ